MSHHNVECLLLFLGFHFFILTSGRFLLRLHVAFCLLKSLARNVLYFSSILLRETHCVICESKFDFGIRLESDVHGINKWLIQFFAPICLVRVDENEVALFRAKVGNSVHECSVMVSWEADSKEARFEAGNGSDPISNLIIKVDTVHSGVPSNIVVLTVCDEHDCQFFQVGLGRKKILNLFKAAHEVGATTCSYIVDSGIVACLVLTFICLAFAVVEICVELLERAFFGIIVFFSDNLSTKLQCLNRWATHRARSIQALNEDFVLSWVTDCFSVISINQSIILLLVNSKRYLGIRVFFVDRKVLNDACFVVALICFNHDSSSFVYYCNLK